MTTVITSQDFCDDNIVDAKRDAKDYEVTLSPEFEIDGVTYRVVIDGHHSLAAAIADGVEPEIVEATCQDHDAIGMIEEGRIEDFLEAVYHGEGWRNVYTGEFVF